MAESAGNMQHQHTQRGFSTVELMIAFALIMLALTGVIVAASGNQSIALDTEMNNSALYKTEEKLENVFSEQTKVGGFSALTSETFIDDISTTTVTITPISECAKRVLSTNSWWEDKVRSQDLSLGTVFVDLLASAAVGHDCSTEELEDEWDTPSSFGAVDIGGAPATAVDVQDGIVFLTGNPASDPPGNPKSDLYIYNAQGIDPATQNPIPVTNFNVSTGLNDVDVAGDYIYLANASTTNTKSSHELLVYDASSFLPVGNITLNVTPNCPKFCPGGAQTIFFYNNVVYLGTHRIGGPEFHTVDVSNPVLTPSDHMDSVEVNHNVNGIAVSEGYAYLATSDDEGELHIYDVQDPNDIQFVGLYDAVNKIGDPSEENDKDGTSVLAFGDRVYLGRANVPNDDEDEDEYEYDFFIIDVSDHANPKAIVKMNLGLNGNETKITGIAARGDLVFLAISDPNDALRILDISDLDNVHSVSLCVEDYDHQQKPTDIELWEGDTEQKDMLFVSNESQKALRIIYDTTNSCS